VEAKLGWVVEIFHYKPGRQIEMGAREFFFKKLHGCGGGIFAIPMVRVHPVLLQ